MLLEDAGILSERRRLVLPVVDLPDHHLERVVCRGRPRAQGKQHNEASRARHAPDDLHAFPPSMIMLFCRSHGAQHSTPGGAHGKAQFRQRRRFLLARLGLALAGAGWAFKRGAFPTGARAWSLSLTRMDQYSHERVRPVVLALIWPARFISPGESVAISELIIMARTWYSALRAE